jgi:hypothetical protein
VEVVVEEIQGSARWSIETGQRLQVEREVIVPWAGHAAWVASQIGTLDPMIPLCRCRRAQVEPLGVITTSPAVYQWARVTLIYLAELDSSVSSSQWPSGASEAPTLPSGASIQVQVRGGGEFLLFPARALRYESNPSGYPTGPIPQEDSGTGRIVVPVQDWVITLGNLGAINRNKLTDRLGKVNQAAFLGYPPETVLFEAWDLDWQWSLDGGAPKVTYSVAWHFKVRVIKRGVDVYGWNHDYVGPPAGWQRVLMGGTPRYESANFADIFLP